MKNKKKGVALLSVIVMMSIVVLFSLLIYSLIIGSSMANTYQKLQTNKLTLTNKIYEDFVDNGAIDGEYELETEVVDGDGQVKALIVKKKNADDLNLYFLAVYDFEDQRVIAKQNSNFQITKKDFEGKEFYYLADVVKYKEV